MGFGAVFEPFRVGVPNEEEGSNALTYRCECNAVPNRFWIKFQDQYLCNICNRVMSENAFPDLRWMESDDFVRVDSHTTVPPFRVVMVVEVDAEAQICEKIRAVQVSITHPDLNVILFHPTWKKFVFLQLNKFTDLTKVTADCIAETERARSKWSFFGGFS